MAVSSGPLDSSKRDWREIGDSSKVDDGVWWTGT